MTREFADIDWTRPLAVEDYVAQVPADAVTKGMFLAAMQKHALALSSATAEQRSFIPFKDYALKDELLRIVKWATAAYPTVPLRQALRSMGATAYPTFAESMIGKTVLVVAGGNFADTLGLVSKSYQISLKPAQVSVTAVSEGRAVVELRNVWSFVDSYHVGVFEGTMQHLDVRGATRYRALSLCDGDLEITWR